jgi:glycerophosphoryl diester phosphodiesterase
MPAVNRLKKIAILYVIIILCGVIHPDQLLSDKVSLVKPVKIHYRSFKDDRAMQTFLQWRPGREPLISAHRGGPMEGFPENAIETFENVLQYAPCLIECDVRLSKDGHLILLHDDTLERTTTGTGLVIDHTLDQLKQLYLKDNSGHVTKFRIPTLIEALQWSKGRGILQLDVKQNTPFDGVVASIRKYKAGNRVMIIVYNIPDLQKVNSMAPELMISGVVRGVEGMNRLFASGVAMNRICAFVGVSEPEPEIYKALHGKGIMAILGTMHNLDNRARARGKHIYRDLYRRGADILATDNVLMVSEAVKEIRK